MKTHMKLEWIYQKWKANWNHQPFLVCLLNNSFLISSTYNKTEQKNKRKEKKTFSLELLLWCMICTYTNSHSHISLIYQPAALRSSSTDLENKHNEDRHFAFVRFSLLSMNKKKCKEPKPKPNQKRTTKN